MIYKTIPILLGIIFILTGCNSSIPITIHGVSPEEYFQGKRKLDSAYVADNYPLYDSWHLVAIGDPRQEVINGIPIRDYSVNLTLTNRADSIKPQYLSYRFIYARNNSKYRFRGIYEFSIAGNLYISDINSKEPFNRFPLPRNRNPIEEETEAWFWNLILSADRYAIYGEYLSLFSGQDVLVFSNRPGSYNRGRIKRTTSR